MMKINPKIKNVFLFVLLFCIILPIVAFAEEAEEEKQCPAFNELNNVSQAAFLVEAYKVIRKVFVAAAGTAWGAFAGPLVGVVAVGIGIYIALATLKNVGAFSQQDVGGYLTADKKGVIPLAIKGASIIFLLQNQSFVYSYLVSPIVAAGGEIGGSGYGGGGAGDVGGLFTMVISIAIDFLGQAYKITALGRMLLCLAFLPDSILEWYWAMIPFGAILFVFGWMIVLGVSFYLLDVMFRLGVGCIVLPMGIACGMSKITSIYTRKNWNLFINVAFNFVMLGIIINFTMQMITQSLSGLSNHTNIVPMLETIGGKVPDKSDTDAINDALTLIGFVLLVLACMVAFKLFLSVEQIAEKVSNTSGVGKMGQEFAQKAANKAKEAVMAPIKRATQAASQALINPSDQKRKVISGSMNTSIGDKIMNSEAGRGIRRGWRRTKNEVKQALNVVDD